MLLEKRVPFIYLFKQIKYDLLFVLIMALCTFGLKRSYGAEVPNIPVALPAFLGTAISLLLSFKLNQSYDRWWEARKIWGSLVNDSRSLVLQTLHFPHSDRTPETLSIMHDICYRQIGFAYCLGQSLRKLDALETAKKFISEKDLRQVSRHQNKPLALLDLQTRDLAKLFQMDAINSFQQIQINNTIIQLSASMGKTERIANTVFPVTYRQILRLFIYIFLVIMSLALLEINSFWEIPLDILIALPFFMIEKTATYMQDPFRNKPTDTAMSTIARSIETNIKQLLEEEDLPVSPDLGDNFYIL